MKLALIPVAGIFDRAVNALEGLPDTAGKIAAFLDDIGVTGIPGSHSRCPLAEYLRDSAQCEYVNDVKVTAVEVVVEKWPLRLAYRLPPHVSEFVLDFDFGRHPALISSSP